MTPVLGTHDIPPSDWPYNQRNTAFLGHRMLQRWVDLNLWERVLDDNIRIKCIFELGTGNGMLSCYLALQCFARDMRFATIDHDSTLWRNNPSLPVMAKLGTVPVCADIFDGHTVPTMIRALPHPMILFCDDGDKPREFATFGPMLSSGDMIVTHDWTEEFSQVNADPIAHLITPFMHEECEAAKSITRFWTVK